MMVSAFFLPFPFCSMCRQQSEGSDDSLDVGDARRLCLILKTQKNFYLILVFIVPGIVALYLRAKFITGRSPSPTENVLTFLVLSLVYYSLTIWLIQKALSIHEPWVARAAIWVLLILIGPALFGLILGIAAQKEWGFKSPARRHVHYGDAYK